MASSSDAVVTLLRIYLQTLGLSLLFVGTGQFIHRTLLAARSTAPLATAVDGLALRWARGYFLGICALLPVFVVLSRVIGAAGALWVAVPLMCAMSLLEVAAARRRAHSLRPVWTLSGALLALIAVYSVTNAAFWLWWGLPPWAEPSLLMHFGSIHSGRYANYAIFIAEHDRVPYLAQNGGQSMLASLHLLLGADSPLAALMAWIPFSMAFLTLLIFGVFRSMAFSVGPCLAATLSGDVLQRGRLRGPRPRVR